MITSLKVMKVMKLRLQLKEEANDFEAIEASCKNIGYMKFCFVFSFSGLYYKMKVQDVIKFHCDPEKF